MVGVAPLAGAGSVGPKRIRPRPLDIYKSIAIIRSEGEDDNGSTRGGGDAGPKTEALANDSTAGPATETDTNQPAKPVYNIPAPVVSEEDKTHFDSQVSREFVTPSAYIRFRYERPDEWEATNTQLNIDILSSNNNSHSSNVAKRRIAGGDAAASDDKSSNKSQSRGARPGVGIGGYIAPEDKVDYELVMADMVWLEKSSKYGPAHYPKDKPGLLTEDMLERMMDLLEKATARNIPIKQSEAVHLFAVRLGIVQTPSYRVSEDVYQHWMNLRMKTKKPLLRRFWPATAPDDNSSHMTFRPREKERYKLRKKRENNLDSYDKLMQIKRDFETVRQMLELVKRREALRRVEALLVQDEFEQTLYQLQKDGLPGGQGAGTAPPKRIRLVECLDDVPGPLELVSEAAQLVVPRVTAADEAADSNAAKAKRIEAQLAELKGRTKKLGKKRHRDHESSKKTKKGASAAAAAGVGGGEGSGEGGNGFAAAAAAGIIEVKLPTAKRRRTGSTSSLSLVGPAGVDKSNVVAAATAGAGAADADADASVSAEGSGNSAAAASAAGLVVAPPKPKPMALPSFLLPLGTFPDGFLASSKPDFLKPPPPLSEPLRVLRELTVTQPHYYYLGRGPAQQPSASLSSSVEKVLHKSAHGGSTVGSSSNISSGVGVGVGDEDRFRGGGGGAKQFRNRSQAAGARRAGFRCRGRVGRGGRLIIDRVRDDDGAVSSDSRHSATGLATSSSWCGPAIMPEQYLGRAKASGMYLDLSEGVEPALMDRMRMAPPPLRHHLVMPDGKVTATGKEMSVPAMNKILDLYAQSDSEDEDVTTLDDDPLLAESAFGFTHNPKLRFLC